MRKPAVGQGVGCTAEPLERRVLLSGGYVLTTLASFNGSNREYPYLNGGLIADAAGNLYGTTLGGGTDNDGTIFELKPIGSITGTVFNDANGDGIRERREGGLAGVAVTLQKFRDGAPIGHAALTTTDAEGDYSFSGLVGGSYRVTQSLAGDQTLTTPTAGSYTITLAAGQNSSGNNFGDFTPTPAYIFTALEAPKAGHQPYGPNGTEANGIAGHTIVGDYYGRNGVDHGFIYNDRSDTFTTLNDPNADAGYYQGTTANGISGNTIVGYYIDGMAVHGFIYNSRTSTYTTLDDPDARTHKNQGTYAHAISGNFIVGSYTASSQINHGFIYNDRTGVYTTLDDPNASQTSYNGTLATSISDNTIVGNYYDSNGIEHGFIYNELTGIYTDLNAGKGAFGTYANGISGSSIVGFTIDRSSINLGFLATPSPASIRGTVFNDHIGNGIRGPHDRGLGDITVTIQKLRDANPIGHAMTTTTDARGRYSFTGLSAGAYRVTQTIPPDQTITTAAGGSYTITLAATQDSTGDDFGDHQKAVRGN